MPWFWGPGMGCGIALMWLACRCGLCPLLLCFFCCCCFFAAKKEFMSMPEATNNKQRNSNKRTITESEYYNGIGGSVGWWVVASGRWGGEVALPGNLNGGYMSQRWRRVFSLSLYPHLKSSAATPREIFIKRGK